MSENYGEFTPERLALLACARACVEETPDAARMETVSRVAAEIRAAEERGRRAGIEEERKRADAEMAQMHNSTIEILTAPRCKCGRFSMSGADRHGLLMLGGTCGRDVLHAPDRCDVVDLAPLDSGEKR